VTADQAAHIAITYTDRLRVFIADRLDEQERCANWARRTAEEQGE